MWKIVQNRPDTNLQILGISHLNIYKDNQGSSCQNVTSRKFVYVNSFFSIDVETKFRTFYFN